MATKKDAMKKFASLISLCKRRGFVFPGSEIYGGLGGSFDYGPTGSQMKLNLKNEWWKFFVTKRPRECFGIDTGILLNPKVWQASGHLDNFSDKMCECQSCKRRIRADHLAASLMPQHTDLQGAIDQLRLESKWHCPYCSNNKTKGELGEMRDFNLLFQTSVGAVSGDIGYLRPETAQGVYINLQNLLKSARLTKPPFGFASMGTVFRNEISPRDFVFRTREFEQMELQWFCHQDGSTQDHTYWVQESLRFCTDFVGLKSDNIRVRAHGKEELAHYSLGTSDLEYNYPSLGFGEFWGISNRGNHDLHCHYPAEGVPLENCHVVEPSCGLNRLFLAALCDAFVEEPGGRTVLKLHPNIAPYQVAVFPLTLANPLLVDECKRVVNRLHDWDCRMDLDESSASVGKKYRRQDEIGTPICLVVDEETLENGTVTFRDRDTMNQWRVKPEEYSSAKLFAMASKKFEL